MIGSIESKSSETVELSQSKNITTSTCFEYTFKNFYE